MIKNLLIKKTSLTILVFCLLFTINGCRKSAPQGSQTPKAPDAAQGSAKSSAISKAMSEIIAQRSSWNPILENFYGKQMPDFKVTDINGKTLSLGDYRGKDVMVVMWATWCLPCMQEVPHIRALREIIPADKLAILAISNEPVSLVKKTAENKEMNYTVISNQEPLPEPFSSIKGIPTAFFIRPDGTLKLVTEGSSYLGEMKSIILAD